MQVLLCDVLCSGCSGQWCVYLGVARRLDLSLTFITVQLIILFIL